MTDDVADAEELALMRETLEGLFTDNPNMVWSPDVRDSSDQIGNIDYPATICRLQMQPIGDAARFDPDAHRINLHRDNRGNEQPPPWWYLEVKWRLVWLRQDHPCAQIETAIVAHDENLAIVRAAIRLVCSGASATGIGTATAQAASRFSGRYIEKAETSALGRACAALGYGAAESGGEFAEDGAGGAEQPRRTSSRPPKGTSDKTTGAPRAPAGDGKGAAPSREPTTRSDFTTLFWLQLKRHGVDSQALTADAVAFLREHAPEVVDDGGGGPTVSVADLSLAELQRAARRLQALKKDGEGGDGA